MKNKTLYPAGPWKFGRINKLDEPLADWAVHIIRDDTPCWVSSAVIPGSNTLEEATATGLLMSASPELFEIANELVMYADMNDDDVKLSGVYEIPTELVEAARNTIAKATGVKS